MIFLNLRVRQTIVIQYLVEFVHRGKITLHILHIFLVVYATISYTLLLYPH